MNVEAEITLIPSPDNPRQDMLIGLNGDREISERVVMAVISCGRLFSHVVEHIADNRMQDDINNEALRNQVTRTVRDELVFAMQSLRESQQRSVMANHHDQVFNMTSQSGIVKLPYFAR